MSTSAIVSDSIASHKLKMISFITLSNFVDCKKFSFLIKFIMLLESSGF